MTGVWIALAVVGVGVALYLVFRGGGSSAGGASASRGSARAPAGATGAAATGGPAGAGRERKVHWLVGNSGPAAGRTFHIGYRTATIGRAPGNLVQVDDSDVSRKHCQLVPGDGFVTVVDMQSQNGTFINGAAVAQGRLGTGDELRVGTATFVYQPYASFDEDFGLGRKQVDPAALKSTTAAKGGSLRLLVEAAIRESGGDLDAAAAQLGVEVSILRKIVDREGIQV